MNLERIKCMYDLGGIKYLLLRAEDKIGGTKKSNAYRYQILSTAPEDQRPRLLKDCFILLTAAI